MSGMAKLDPYADSIKRHYRECRNAHKTWELLRADGVKISYESLRTWLQKHADELPPLRSGGGKPKSTNREQLFPFIPEKVFKVSDDMIQPEIFLAFTEKASPEAKKGYLFTYLKKFGIKISLNRIDEAELPLKRFRNLCDFEVYFFTYLLAEGRSLVGVSEKVFADRTRAIIVMSVRLRAILTTRNSISVGELRRLIRIPKN
jgi:hypothetical protein